MSGLQGKQRQSKLLLPELLKGALPWPWRGEKGASSNISMSWRGLCSPQVCPRTVNTCNTQSFFLFVSFPLLEVARKGKAVKGLKLLKVKLLQVLSEPQWKCFGVRGAQQEENTQALACLLLLSFVYKHLSLQLLLELFYKEAACPAAVISSSILQAPESRPGIWPLHCVSQASAMVSWVVFLGWFLSHSFWEIQPNWDARLLGRYRVCGRHQPALEHEGKADKIGMVLIAGSLQCSCKHKGCSCETPRIEGVLFFVRLTNVNLKSG